MIETAVILCAGGGTRLRPLTNDRPKALLDVGGETILGRAGRLLVEKGVRHLVVATGYRAEAVRASLADCRVSVTFCHNPDFERTQNSVSLGRCREKLSGRAFFKLDGDLVFQSEVITRLEAAAGMLSAAVDKSAALGDEEMKVMTDGDRILRFGKELPPARCSGESIGIEKIDAVTGDLLFHALERAAGAGRTNLYYEDVYSELIAGGLVALAVDVSDLGWFEVDTPEDLGRVRRTLARGGLDGSA